MSTRLITSVFTLLLGTFACAAEVDFNQDIRPILSQNCFACHGPDPAHRKAKLRLDTEAGSRKAITPGNPEESELLARITHNDPDEIMPPPDSGKELKPGEIELLRQWITEGAAYAEPWAYAPPKKSEIKGEQWIDQMIIQQLQEKGLELSPQADPVTLARRLHFDLIGLPPTPETVTEFARDGNYEQLVDRLLASDHFGERLAIYWLDLVRFADTVGYHGDQTHNISPYRDYVIDAFNRNLPFDQFTREQLAGDLLEDPSIDQKVATGYNRLLQTSHEGGVQTKEYLAIYAADRVRNVSAVWMGGTLGCAQCHDHKYDPYTAKDFYSMAAFFADVDEAQHFKVGTNSLPTKRPPEIDVLSRRDRETLAALNDPKEIEAFEKTHTRRTMVTEAIEPRVIRVLPRGNWLDDSGEIVQAAVPEFLGELDTGDRRATRLDLADWLTDPEHGVGGLTARVFANRVWYLLLGEGISSSLGDFGGQGTPPSYPGLLDQLAVEFYESNWDIKHLVKQIIMSQAYRQSSIAPAELLLLDPNNQLFARQSRYRLPAEIIRDNALALGGLLNLGYGGASTKPAQPAGYYRHLNFPVRKYKAADDSSQYRRGVYVHWQRQFLHPSLKSMDAPSREECTAKRPRSNTPTAAMVLLNDPNFVEAAEALATRIIKQGGMQHRERLEFAYRTVLSRSPDEEERKLLGKLFASHEDEAAAWKAVARTLLNLSETTTRN
ncbi:MAG: hypothetical protein ACI8XO_002625 [Verrucomicrobiales bacterium]